MPTLTRFVDTEPTKTDERKFKFKISDESRDRYGTVIKLDGWKLDNYKRNPIVAYNHITWGSNPDNIIGKGRAWVEDGALWGEVELEPDNPTAEKVMRRIDFGTLRASSVGFNPTKYSWGDEAMGEDPKTLYFRNHELLEWSIVDVPANPNAELQRGYAEFVQKALEEINQAEAVEDKEAPAITGPDEFITKLLTVKMYQL